MQRTVFFISDRTAITTETLGHSLLTQFPDADFRQVRLPFVDDPEKAGEAVKQVNEATRKDGARAIVFTSIVDQEVSGIMRQCDGVILDLFATFLAPLEAALDILPVAVETIVGDGGATQGWTR